MLNKTPIGTRVQAKGDINQKQQLSDYIHVTKSFDVS